MPIELKRDPYLWGFSAFLVCFAGALVWHGDATFKEGAAFITGALAMPALFGRKTDSDELPRIAMSDRPGSPDTPPTIIAVADIRRSQDIDPEKP